MATKTICDKCGGECVNTVVCIRINIVHKADGGQYVGEDECPLFEMCNACGQALIAAYGIIKHGRLEFQDSPDPERAIAHTGYGPVAPSPAPPFPAPDPARI